MIALLYIPINNVNLEIYLRIWKNDNIFFISSCLNFCEFEKFYFQYFSKRYLSQVSIWIIYQSRWHVYRFLEKYALKATRIFYRTSVTSKYENTRINYWPRASSSWPARKEAEYKELLPGKRYHATLTTCRRLLVTWRSYLPFLLSGETR